MGKRLALVIGNSVYRDSTLARLLTPDADVGTLADILLDAEVGGFDDVNVLINMSFATVRREISAFFSGKKQDDLLVLYFSGHGVLDDLGRLHLAVKDTERAVLRATAIPANFITDEMDNSRSRRQVLILDCCHSGAFARGAKGRPGGHVGTGDAFEGTGFGRVVLTASDATQYAWEGDQVIGEAENSVFTHYLVRGLHTGEADADKDGEITVDELYDYVYDQVVKHAHKQTPGKWSFREQGDIVIARNPHLGERPPAVPTMPDVDEEFEQRLERLYTRGLGAFWLEDWEKAARSFLAIVDVRPEFQDAADKLKEAQRQLNLNNLYEKALAAMETGDWAGSITALEILVTRAPDFKDAQSKLQAAKTKQQLADLYSEAQRLYQAKQWQAAIKVFDIIAAIKPDYEDSEGLLGKAKKEAAAEERLKKLENLYNRALREMNTGNWQNARQLLVQVREEEPDFLETERLIERVEFETSRDDAERQQVEQIDALYEEALRLIRTQQWQQAHAKIQELQAVDPQFPDPERIATRVEEGLRQEEEEGKQRTELAGLYAEAVRQLRSGQYREALDTWDAVRIRDPQFVDKQDVRATALSKLSESAPPMQEERLTDKETMAEPRRVEAPRALGDHPLRSLRVPRWAWAAAAVVLVVIMIFAARALGTMLSSRPERHRIWIRPDDDAEMVYVPAGEFLMGSEPVRDPEAERDEQPQHRVTLSAFWIDSTEVTNAKYAVCVQERMCAPSASADEASFGLPDLPVVGVDWNDARAYCQWVGGDLPTEAQWEKAARGIEGQLYPWGRVFDSLNSNYCDASCPYRQQRFAYVDGHEFTAPVDSFPSGVSPYGALNMAGNVWEWVVDCYDSGFYSAIAATVTDPSNSDVGCDRNVIRGGSWASGQFSVRSANRQGVEPGKKAHDIGFRCVVPATP